MRGCVVAVLLAVLLTWGLTRPAHGHGEGGGGKSDVTVTLRLHPAGITVAFTQQLDRQGAFAELLAMDSDGDGRPSKVEQANYFHAMHQRIGRDLLLRVNGKPMALRAAGEVQLAMPFRKTFRFDAEHAPGWERGATLAFHNEALMDTAGSAAIEVVTEASDASAVHMKRIKAPADTVVFASPAKPTDKPASQQAGMQGVLTSETTGEVASSGGFREMGRDVFLRFAATLVSLQEHAAREASDMKQVATLAPGRTPMPGLGSNVPRAAWIWYAVGFCVTLWLAWSIAKGRKGMAVVLAAALIVCVSLAWRRGVGSAPAITILDAHAIAAFQRVHRQLYEAYGAATETELYESLARSLSGPALEQAYLAVHKARFPDNAEPREFSIRRIRSLSTTRLPSSQPDAVSAIAFDPHADRFHIQHRWRVVGVVSHYGHRHKRVAEYEAIYTLQREAASPGASPWRITAVRLTQQERQR